MNHHAGNKEEAVRLADLAAQELLDSGDPAAAEAQWGRALRYLGRSREGRADLRLAQAEARLTAGRASAAIRAFSAARRWSTDPAKRLRARARRTLARVRAGQFDQALIEADRVAPELRQGGEFHGIGVPGAEDRRGSMRRPLVEHLAQFLVAG